LRSAATIWRPCSISTQRAIRPRTTTASSTTITRSGSCPRAALWVGLARAIVIEKSNSADARERTRTSRQTKSGGSDQPGFLELRLDDFLVERLHDLPVGSAVQGPS